MKELLVSEGGISKYLLKKQSEGGELCIQPWSWGGTHAITQYYSSLEPFISVAFVEAHTCPGSLSPKMYLYQSSFFQLLVVNHTEGDAGSLEGVP